jgi:hypothetical protein
MGCGRKSVDAITNILRGSRRHPAHTGLSTPLFDAAVAARKADIAAQA